MSRSLPKTSGLSRRGFLERGALYGGSLFLWLQVPRPLATQAAQESTRPATFSPAEWRTVEAITARILPSDDGPGAREAGCVNFIDKALAHEDGATRPVYEQGLAGLAALCTRQEKASFADLPPARQDAVLASLQADTAKGWPAGDVTAAVFFETLRVHTLIGFLADPVHGGNRDYVGWKLLGYPGPRHEKGGYTPAQMLGEQDIEAIWGEKV